MLADGPSSPYRIGLSAVGEADVARWERERITGFLEIPAHCVTPRRRAPEERILVKRMDRVRKRMFIDDDDNNHDDDDNDNKDNNNKDDDKDVDADDDNDACSCDECMNT